jgi:hypothetical protein
MASRSKANDENDIDRLFEVPPEEFIGARDELAKRLKGEGRTEDAARVRSLRRPTVAAWAANQVARRHPEDVKELLEAGAALRQAQRKVLSGVRAGGFREGMERRRQVVNRLTRAAEKVLRESGHASAGTAEAVTATLEAASLDEEAADQFRAGRMSKELPAPAGFGAAAGLELVPGEPEPKEGRPAKPSKVREAAAREAKELSAATAQARRRAIKARDEADRLEAKAERLKQEVEETRIAAREASKRAREAESEADRAQSEADRATAQLDH